MLQSIIFIIKLTNYLLYYGLGTHRDNLLKLGWFEALYALNLESNTKACVCHIFIPKNQKKGS